MRFGSVCSGIEAASVAWHPLGWRAAWLAEIEPFPSAVLAHHYPDVPNLGDMTALPERILAGEVEAPDLFCGGTPCQAFSVAGLRRSLDDARGNLSLTFCEIADAIDHVRLAGGKPASIVFWENVPGVLSTADNAFGCFLGALAGCDTAIVPSGRWTDAGVVAGPQRTVAWRILDAQFFGLAQRRKRVFVVASAREGFDPAAVLLEWEGVRRDSAPSREAGEGAACGAAPSFGIRSANTSSNGWGIQRELTHTLDTASPQMVAQAFGGGQNCAETDVSTALSAHPGGSRLDFQTETFIAHTLRGEGFDASEDGSGRGTPLVPVHVPEIAGTMKACKDSGGWSNSADHAAAGYMVPVAFDTYNQTITGDATQTLCSRGDSPGGNAHLVPAVMQPVAHAFDARQSHVIQYGDKTGPLDTDGHSIGVMQPVGVFQDSEFGVQQYDNAGTLRAGRIPEHQMVLQPVAFDTTQITSAANYSNPKPGDPYHPLAAGAHAPAIAFSRKDHGADATADLAPTLRAMNHAESHANGGGQMAVAVDCYNGAIDGDTTLTLRKGNGNALGGVPATLHAMQVRRLTPVECERLQGFPDDYTAIPWRGKPASECPDGPRYKALGNSWAVPCVRWIGQRIQDSL